MAEGTFYLSVINYPFGPPYQPNTPICTLFCIGYFGLDNKWGHFTDWTGIYNPVAITCDLANVQVVAYVGNSDPNDPNSPMVINGVVVPSPAMMPLVDGGHYRLDLNARPTQDGIVVFEEGDWIPGLPAEPAKPISAVLLIGAGILAIGAILALKSRK